MRFSSKHHRAVPVLVITALVAVAGTAGAASDTTSPPDGTAASEDSAAPGSAPNDELAAVAADLREIGFDQIADSVDAASEGDVGDFELAGSIADKVAAGEPFNYVFSYQSSAIANFSDQYAAGYEGTLDVASSVLPMNPESIAPATPGTDVPQQIAQIEALLNTEQIDCLAIEPADSNSFTDIVQRAIDAGIPVFTVGVTSNGAEFSNFTQVPLEEGAFVADGVLAFLEENDIDAQVFTVSGGDPSQFWAQGRMEGFQTRILEEIPDAEFINTFDNALTAPYEPAGALDAYNAFLAGNPEVDVIMNADIGAEHAATAIADAGLTGEAFSVGWNVAPGSLDAIDAGTQIATYDQEWSQQAGFGAVACAVYLATGLVMPNTQHLTEVNASNSAEARAELEQILGG
jgi:ABC-type sugar transport system substrate-binding protein